MLLDVPGHVILPVLEVVEEAVLEIVLEHVSEVAQDVAPDVLVAVKLHVRAVLDVLVVVAVPALELVPVDVPDVEVVHRVNNYVNSFLFTI